MKIKHLILGASLTLGLAASAAAFSFNKGALMTSAYGSGDTTWYVAGTFNSWNLADEDCHLTYSKMAGNNWEFESDNTISLEEGDEFKIVYSWNNGAGANYFSPDLNTNSVDFKKVDEGNIQATRDITATFFFQVFGEGATWTGLYWEETETSKLAAANGFAATFLTATADYCEGSVDSTTQTNLKNAYDALGGAKNAFYEATVKRGKGQTYANNVEEALSRYVNMIEEKGYTDFLDLGTNLPSSSKYTPFAFNNETNVTPLIIVVSALLIAGAATGGYFMIRRRKENN